MATIRLRKQADSSTRDTAIVRIRRGKTIVYQESKTFALRTAAVSWTKHRQAAPEGPGALKRVDHGTPTIAKRSYIHVHWPYSWVKRRELERPEASTGKPHDWPGYWQPFTTAGTGAVESLDVAASVNFGQCEISRPS
jgi:hypothetical protein